MDAAVQSVDFTLPSGAKLTITESGYRDVRALLNALLKSAKGIPLSANPLDMDVTVLKDAFIEASTSDEVDQALFKCAEKAVYENSKVTRDLFDDPKLKAQARADHFIIMWHVIEVNCAPFFAAIFSALKERLASNRSSRDRSSTPTTSS